MTEGQKRKRNVRATKKWKLKKLAERKRAGNKDEITLKPLRKGWQLHHECLDESEYDNMSHGFLCVNNLTHKMIHWLWTYWQKDKDIIERLKSEMLRMEEENAGTKKGK
jgi:hypothetical protein